MLIQKSDLRDWSRAFRTQTLVRTGVSTLPMSTRYAARDARDFGNQAPRHDPRDGSVERTPARLHLPSQSMPRQDVPTTQILSQLLNALPRCPFGASNFGYCVAS